MSPLCPSVLRPVLLLALLATAAVMPGVTARSIERQKDTGVEGRPVLEILIDGEVREEDQVLVHRNAGESLTLNCIAQGYNPPSVSWWERDTELVEAKVSRSTYATSSVLQLKELRGLGSERSFTCRSSSQEPPRTVELHIAEPVELLVNGDPLPDYGLETVVMRLAHHSDWQGVSLNCIVQGYHLPTLSWWEGETELSEAKVSRSEYATGSVLQLKELKGTGSARSFTCRSSGQEAPRTVELHIAVSSTWSPWIIAESITAIVMLGIFGFLVHSFRTRYNSRGMKIVHLMETHSQQLIHTLKKPYSPLKKGDHCVVVPVHHKSSKTSQDDGSKSTASTPTGDLA